MPRLARPGRKLLRAQIVRRWLPRWFFQMNRSMRDLGQPMACRARMRAGIRRVCRVRRI